jgi:hypothetical protein
MKFRGNDFATKLIGETASGLQRQHDAEHTARLTLNAS